MPISDKTRKALWARSGNRCAICRVALIVEKTPKDAHCVIGEECHIISPAGNGPRHQSDFPPEEFDSLDNLVLLCAIHHKQIDDQSEAYSADVVRSIKRNHEQWVELKLRDGTTQPVRVRRFKENIPKQLPRMTSGKELLAIASNAAGHYFDHEDDLSETEAEQVGGFIQEITDWIDLCSDSEPIEKVRTASRIQRFIDDLEIAGFFVFAASEVQQLEGGTSTPTSWRVLHITVVRASNPAVQPQSRPYSSSPNAAED